ncbi:hypothetical protein BWQ93_05850 [Sphingopyxis sp. QXT-31]|nr:hypothetical protein BWQ93_05850 [Sphingopyxis sp. QXT-31]
MPWDGYLLPWSGSPCPSFIRPEIFDEITNEAVAVSRRWGAQAIEAGWSTIDLFGCWRHPQYRRVDCNGLVASIVGLLTPVRVTALSPTRADLTDHLGNVMRFYRRPMPFAVHLWEAYAMPAGP